MTATPRQPVPAGDSTSRHGQATTPGPASEVGVPTTRDRAGTLGADAIADRLPSGDHHHAKPAEGRRWQIEFPAGMELLTSNQSANWGRTHRIGTEIKNTAIWLCRNVNVPHLALAAFVLEYQPPTAGRPAVRDAQNLSPTLKKIVDGVVVAGVLTDDSDRYVARVTYRRGDKHPGGRVVLHILEVLNPSEHPS